MNTNEKLLEKLRASSLSSYEMSLWERVFQSLPEESQQNILSVFNSQTDGVRILTDNLVAKTAALESMDISQWEDALKHDASVISNALQ